MYVYRKIQKKTRVTTKIFMKWIFSRDFNINFKKNCIYKIAKISKIILGAG